MKKFGAFLLAFIVLLSCFVFTGCGTKNITDYITHTSYNHTYTSEGHVFFVTCYVSRLEFDISTASKVEIKVNGEKVTANYISDTDYFTFTYVDEDFEYADIEIDRVTATISKEAKDKENDEYGISIGGMILLGLFITLGACLFFWLALAGGSNVTMLIINGAMVIFTLGSWLTFGVARGIIMTVFLILYFIATSALASNY